MNYPSESPAAVEMLPAVTDGMRAEVREAALYLVDAAEEQARRNSEFATWVATVRDPAEKANEGVRRIRTKDRKAEASYEIAPLPDGRYAITSDLQYLTGDFHGHGTPWTAYPTREACLAAFLDDAKRHFSGSPEMLALLEGDGLFGFMEPSVEPAMA